MKNRYFRIYKQLNRVLVVGARHSDLLSLRERVIQHLSVSVNYNTDYNIKLEKVVEDNDQSYSFQPTNSATPIKFEILFNEQDHYQQEIENNNKEVSFNDTLKITKPHFAFVIINMDEVNFNGLSGQLQYYYDHANEGKVIPSFLILNFKKFIPKEIRNWCVENQWDLTTYIFVRVRNKNIIPLEIIKEENSPFKNLLREIIRFYKQNHINPNSLSEFSNHFRVFSSEAAVNIFIQHLFQVILSTDRFNNYHFENLTQEIYE